MNSAYQPSSKVLRRETGIVIPVYFPDGMPFDVAFPLVCDNVESFTALVKDPAAVCVIMDGKGRGGEEIRKLCARLGIGFATLPVNKGKLFSVREGVRLLLKNNALKYIAVVDQDGDHFPNELANFVRMAEHMTATAGTDRLMVLGQRNRLHHSMSYQRGELEELVDRITLDALQYNAAVTGKPLRMEYATLGFEWPDFHSGYKLFSRQTAEDVFVAGPNLADTDEACYYRHCVEVVMSVEAILGGAALGIVRRTSFNEQPISAFKLLERGRLFADMIIWPCRRLGIPAEFVRQWMANHVPRIQINTLVPEGRDEIKRVVELVTAAFPDGGEPSDPFKRRPLFV